MRPYEGPAHGEVLVDRGREGHTLGKAHVVVQEGLLPLVRPELDADANLGPRPVETFEEDVLQDAMMEVHDIRRGSITVLWSHKNRPRVQLLRLLQNDLVIEDLLHSAGELLHPPHVDGLPGRRGSEVHGVRRNSEDKDEGTASVGGLRGPGPEAPRRSCVEPS